VTNNYGQGDNKNGYKNLKKGKGGKEGKASGFNIEGDLT
jgi:hypothetical protein